MNLIDSIYDILPELYANPKTNIIFHYTNPTGLNGIISSKKLWLSELSYMNDPNEIKYGMHEFNNEVLGQLNKILKSQKYNENDFQCKILNSMIQKFHDGDFVDERYVFILSFCENGDLLSQWKGYANYGEGYSIGFKINSLKQIDGAILGRVIYDDKKKKAIIAKIIDGIISDEKQYLKLGQEKYMINAFATMHYFSCFFKSSYFTEECEWRLVCHYTENKKLNILLRPSKLGLIPYIEIDISNIFNSIDRIIIGPKLDFFINRKVLSMKVDRQKIVPSSNNLQ